MDEHEILLRAMVQDAGGGGRILTRFRAGEPLPRGPVARRLEKAGLETRIRGRLAAARELGYEPLAGEVFPGFRNLPEPPLLVYAAGEPPAVGRPVLAMVGSRRPSGYGLRMARRLAGEVAAAGVSVVSGLARGIDGEAHEGALEAGGHTVAVLGSGPDRVYPPEHEALLARIQEEGCVLTEHLPGTPPRKHHFPRRNRLMVALARALLVVQARVRSGTLTSVRWAADLGREVLVLPGPVDAAAGEGPLLLLREGATPVGSAAHVLEALGLEEGSGKSSASPGVSTTGLSPAEERVLALLDGEPLDLDEVVRLSGEAPGRLLALLLGLEARGLVQRDQAMRYGLRSPG